MNWYEFHYNGNNNDDYNENNYDDDGIPRNNNHYVYNALVIMSKTCHFINQKNK